jgi:hypothetical protein
VLGLNPLSLLNKELFILLPSLLNQLLVYGRREEMLEEFHRVVSLLDQLFDLLLYHLEVAYSLSLKADTSLLLFGVDLDFSVAFGIFLDGCFTP